MSRWRVTATLVAAVGIGIGLGLGVAGCDPQRVEKLEEGVSTEVQVRKQFGEPATVTNQSDGSKILEYPRQPEGWTNYEIRIGADGKMSALRQLLNEDNFRRVVPGQDKLQVRAALGRPAEIKSYALKGDEEVWSWRFKPGTESRMFSATFASDGRVVSTAIADDPREQAQTGR
jgi:outer membrane protein assembly factor BamE (lipoprotein component of BamABCDE complex)